MCLLHVIIQIEDTNIVIKMHLKRWIEIFKLGDIDRREEVMEEMVAKPCQHHCHRHCHCHLVHHYHCDQLHFHHLYDHLNKGLFQTLSAAVGRSVFPKFPQS